MGAGGAERRLAADPAPAEPPHDRESLRRAVRELEAAEARVQRDAERAVNDARGALVGELLPVLDNLERTIDAAAQQSDPALLAGARMVYAQLAGVIARYGVERIDARGQRFDPEIHEALAAVPVTEPARAGAVLEQYQAGYRYAGKLLRPAKVMVGVLSTTVGATR